MSEFFNALWFFYYFGAIITSDMNAGAAQFP